MKTNFLNRENEWNELVFENRNKNYGAYVLRSGYNQTILKAYIYTISALFALAIAFYLKSRGTPATAPVAQRPYILSDIFTIPETVEPKIISKKIPPLPPASQTHTSFKISDSAQNTFTDTQSMRATQTSATTTNVTNGDDGHSGTSTTTTAGITTVEGGSVNNPAAYAEVPPQFPGGAEAFDRYIKSKVNFAKAKQAGIEHAKVVVSFIIDPEGNIIQTEAVSHNGFGMEQAVEEALRNMPKWTPGKNANTNVYVKLFLPIRYELE
ncbi:MAG: energy transducer TonB [Bacteroidia bacterium]|nr:energy transducer TonB [Bacteroidia bacterium]